MVAACAMRVVAEAPRGLRPVLLLLRADAVVQSPRPTRRIGCSSAAACRAIDVAATTTMARRHRPRVGRRLGGGGGGGGGRG